MRAMDAMCQERHIHILYIYIYTTRTRICINRIGIPAFLICGPSAIRIHVHIQGVPGDFITSPALHPMIRLSPARFVRVCLVRFASSNPRRIRLSPTASHLVLVNQCCWIVLAPLLSGRNRQIVACNAKEEDDFTTALASMCLGERTILMDRCAGQPLEHLAPF